MARNLKRSTNVQAGGFGFFEAMEKHVHKQLHQNKLGFPELCTLAENILANGIGSTEFQKEVESFLLEAYTADNLQVVTDLLKGLSGYRIKTPELELRLFQTLHLHRDDFTVKQLETLIWALSRYSKVAGEVPPVANEIIERVKTKAASMKPRGVAFAIESIASMGHKDEATYKRLEKVLLSKLDDFIPHYLVKVLSAYYRMGYGCGELYDKLISGLVKQLEALKYSDALRFFEIFPEVSYIYDSTMSEDLYSQFTEKVSAVIKDKKFPTEDVCRALNILVRLSPYASEDPKFVTELLGKLRHSVYDVPKDQFSLTMSNLIEYQQPELASKFVFILQEVAKQGKLLEEFPEGKDRIRLFWALLQIERACTDPLLVSPETLSFLNDVDAGSLDARHFLLYKQLLCLSRLWFAEAPVLDYDRLYERLGQLSAEKREDFINEDPATKSSQHAVTDLARILKPLLSEVTPNLSDDFMSLVDVAAADGEQMVALLLMNKHCYIRNAEGEQVVKRSVELKTELLEESFDWRVLVLDQEQFLALKSFEEKASFVRERLGLTETPAV